MKEYRRIFTTEDTENTEGKPFNHEKHENHEKNPRHEKNQNHESADVCVSRNDPLTCLFISLFSVLLSCFFVLFVVNLYLYSPCPPCPLW